MKVFKLSSFQVFRIFFISLLSWVWDSHWVSSQFPSGFLLLRPSISTCCKYLTKFVNNLCQREENSSHFLKTDRLYRKILSIFTICAAPIFFKPHPNYRYEIQIIISVFRVLAFMQVQFTLLSRTALNFNNDLPYCTSRNPLFTE